MYNNRDSRKGRRGIWLTKILLGMIVFLLVLIGCNLSNKFRDIFTNKVLEENINFYQFKNVIDKFLNKNDNTEVQEVSGDVVSFLEYEGRYIIQIDQDEGINFLKPGIIVYIGDKDNLGNTVIVQGNDGVDLWYSGVILDSHELYDYVSVKDLLGISENTNYILSIYKDGELLKYEEYF